MTKEYIKQLQNIVNEIGRVRSIKDELVHGSVSNLTRNLERLNKQIDDAVECAMDYYMDITLKYDK